MESAVERIPELATNAGPRDPEWRERLRQEYGALIHNLEINYAKDNEWFTIEPDDSGVHWKGKCWYIYELVKYEFTLEFDIPATYPATPIELRLPELDGKTPKMYRGGKICLDIHFSPLWSRKQPSYGIAHALALALGPWLAAEVPILVEQGVLNNS